MLRIVTAGLYFGAFKFVISNSSPLRLLTNAPCDGCKGVNKGEFYYVLYDDLPQTVIAAINQRLQANKPRLLSMFDVSTMSTVVVRVWGDKENFLAAQEATIGERHPMSTGYVTLKQGAAAGELRLLYVAGETAKTAVHELAHIVMLEVNPRFANNPRWLWESLAIYATEPKWQEAEFLNAHRDLFASMAQTLFEGPDTGAIYSIGYTVGEYIEHTWGREALISLIKSNGDFSVITEKSITEVFSDWQRFVAVNYFFQRPPKKSGPAGNAQSESFINQDWGFK